MPKDIDLTEPVEKKEKKTIPPFKIFCNKFEKAWKKEYNWRYSHLKRNNYFYEIKGNKISIYLQTKSIVKAILQPDFSWIDDSHLFSILKEYMPDYIEYFKNRTKLIK